MALARWLRTVRDTFKTSHNWRVIRRPHLRLQIEELENRSVPATLALIGGSIQLSAAVEAGGATDSTDGEYSGGATLQKQAVIQDGAQGLSAYASAGFTLTPLQVPAVIGSRLDMDLGLQLFNNSRGADGPIAGTGSASLSGELTLEVDPSAPWEKAGDWVLVGVQVRQTTEGVPLFPTDTTVQITGDVDDGPWTLHADASNDFANNLSSNVVWARIGGTVTLSVDGEVSDSGTDFEKGDGGSFMIWTSPAPNLDVNQGALDVAPEGFGDGVGWNGLDIGGGIRVLNGLGYYYPPDGIQPDRESITVAAYWASGETWETRLSDTPAAESVVEIPDIGTAEASLALTRGEFTSAPPQGAKYLLVVLDPPTEEHPEGVLRESSERDNLRALPIPDLKPKSLTWAGPTSPGLLNYEIEALDANGNPYDAASRLTGPDLSNTEVSFYWASGPDQDDILSDDPVAEATGLSGSIDRANFASPQPPEATHLVMIVDPPDEEDGLPDGQVMESDKTNNALAVELPKPDIAVLNFFPSFGGLVGSVSYEVQNGPLDTDVPIAYYWASGPDPEETIGGPAYSALLDGTPGIHFTPAVPLSSLGDRPDGATYLVAIADPDDEIDESDESNNDAAVVVPKPDIVMISLFPVFSGNVGGLLYSVQNGPLDQDIPIDFYWATGPNPTDTIGGPAYSILADSRNSFLAPFPLSNLGQRPDEATYLIAVADRRDEIDESNEDNNSASVQLPSDFVAVNSQWDEHRGGAITDPRRGFDFTFDVLGGDQLPDIEFQWLDASGTELGTAERLTASDVQSLIAGQRPPGGETLIAQRDVTGGKEYTINVPARWGAVPRGAGSIAAVLDPDDDTDEVSEDNNVTTLRIHTKQELLDGAILPSPGPGQSPAATFILSFLPGGQQNLTLSEAEVAFGVDHFNWVQTVRLPDNMIEELWRGGSLSADHTSIIGGQYLGIPSPAYDPVVDTSGTQSDQYFIDIGLLTGGQFNHIAYAKVPRSATEDASAPYLDEAPAGWQTQTGRGGTVSATTFELEDKPVVGRGILTASQSIAFTTKLVGVAYPGAAGPGTWTFLDGGNTGVSWHTNATSDVTTDAYLATAPTAAPLVSSGGIFDVRFDDGTPVPGFPTDPPLLNSPPTAPRAQVIALGSDAGAPSRVRVLSPTTGAVLRDFSPFGAYAGGVRVAVGDLNGDGTDDYVAATARGIAAAIAYDGATGAPIGGYLPFGLYPAGAEVAVGDMDGDGFADLVMGLDTGPAVVAVYSGRTGELIRVFDAFPGFGGGVRLAAGDVNGDGKADIAVAAGPGGLGVVVVYDGATGAPLSAFFALPGYGGEVNVAMGDLTGDGRVEVITTISGTFGTLVEGFGPGGDLARALLAPTATRGDGGAARVATADVNGDRIADILLGDPPGAGSNGIRLLDGATGGMLLGGTAFDPLLGPGVYVGM